jgi:hypothetical protein
MRAFFAELVDLGGVMMEAKPESWQTSAPDRGLRWIRPASRDSLRPFLQIAGGLTAADLRLPDSRRSCDESSDDETVKPSRTIRR